MTSYFSQKCLWPEIRWEAEMDVSSESDAVVVCSRRGLALSAGIRPASAPHPGMFGHV